MQLPYKDYIGDAVYAEFNGYDIILTTENGIEATNTIVLEPNVIEALKNFIKRIESEHNQEQL